jgi:hypothetical protein
MLRRRTALVMSVPPHLLERVRPHAEQWAAADLRNAERVQALVGHHVDRGIGPAFIGYADATTFKPLRNRQARMLNERDTAAMERLRVACSTRDWEDGGVILGHTHALGTISAMTSSRWLAMRSGEATSRR